MKYIYLITIAALVACGAVSAQKAPKLSADEIVAKHLESIGSAEARAAIKSRIFVGVGRMTGKVGFNGQLSGPAQFASEGDKLVYAMLFNSNDYPYEKVGYDGKDITVGRPTITSSQLGAFVRAQKAVLQQGLFGGALSSAWPLYDLAGTKAKVDAAGITKQDGKEFYKLKFTAKGGSLKVSLYFELETFHHVMTEYEYTVPPPIGPSREENASMKESHFSMVERFSDFKKAGDVVLPFSYVIDVAAQNQGESRQLQWEVIIKQAFFNQSLEEGSFRVS